MTFASSPIASKRTAGTAFNASLEKLSSRVDEGVGSAPVSFADNSALPPFEGYGEHEKLAAELELMAEMPGAVAAMQGRRVDHEKVASDMDAILGREDRTLEALEKMAYVMVVAEAEEAILGGVS